MNWTVRIQNLSPSARAKLPQIAASLGRLPGLNPVLVQRGLQTLPYDIAVQNSLAGQKLVAGLQQLGLSCTLIPPSPPAAPHRPRKSFPLIDEPTRGVRIELRDDSLPAPPKPNRWHSRQSLLWGGALVVLAVGLLMSFLWFSPTPPTSSPPPLSTAPPNQSLTEKEVARRTEMAAQKRLAKKRYQKTLEQMAHSEKLFQESQRTPDVRKSAALLSQALKLNPYNLSAWKLLAAKHRRMGDDSSAQQCEIAWQRHDRTQKTLEGIARYFGGKPQAKLSVAKVEFSIDNSALSAQEFHQKSQALYDTLQTQHAEKAFQVERPGTEPLSLEVLPGEEFPSLDSWESLERKGHKPQDL